MGRERTVRTAVSPDNVPAQGALGGGIYTAPMDHSYRAAQGNNNGNTHKPGRGGRMNQPLGKEFAPPEPEPLPVTPRTRPRASLPSSTICSSWPRSRRRRAR